MFVDTGPDLKNRERILKVLQKKLPTLTVLDAPEGAEVVLVFSADSATYLAGMTTQPPAGPGWSAQSTPTYATVALGTGYVVIPKDNRMRVLMQVEKSARFRWSKWPSESFAKEFVKAYQKANGMGDK